MTVSEGYCTFIVDALSRVLHDKPSTKMFGGVWV